MDKKLLYLFLFLLAGCGKGEKSSPNVFFAGEIVNPTSDYVVLYEGECVIDSAQLDEHNRFAFKLDSIKDGLYHFNHAPEYQYIYLKKGDSLAIRLNTVAFDESLVFSGKGEEINNFLLELFLTEEDEQSEIYSSYRLASDEFLEKINSLAAEKLEQLASLKQENVLTEKEIKIAEASINYTYNTFKEKYPFIHRKYSKDKKIKKLPDNFYDYRKDLSFDDSDLTYLRPYYNFMNYHFGNVSFMTCSHKCQVENDVVGNKLHFNKHKLKLIDSIVQEKELKDNLFRNVAMDYLLKNNDIEENKIFIDQFHKFSNNNKHIDEINSLYQGVLNIQPGKDLPTINVQNLDGEMISLQDISKGKKTIFYFWSGTEKRHFNELTKRISSLGESKSDYELVGINIRTEEPIWKGMIKSNQLNAATQFRSTNSMEMRRAFIIDKLNKCIIAEDGKIVNAFSDIFSNAVSKEIRNGTESQIAKN